MKPLIPRSVLLIFISGVSILAATSALAFGEDGTDGSGSGAAPGAFANSGKLTYYGGNPSGGACGFDQPVYYADTDYVDYYAAAGASVFDSGNNCGMVIEVAAVGPFDPSNTGCLTLPDVTIKVMVIDQCPECTDSHLDLAPVPFASLVEPGLAGTCGVLEASWQFVPADLSGTIHVHSKEGTSAFWYGFRLYGHDLPIATVELQSSGSSTWLSASKSQGPSFYLLEGGGYPLTAPLSVRITDQNGRVITATGVITNFDGEAVFDTGVQINKCGADERVSGNQCVACPPGTTNARGDDVTGADTECDVVSEIVFEDGFEDDP